MARRSHFGPATMLGTLVAGLVIAGLLHFPSTCECGARLPHTHSLFQMAGHHHARHAGQSERAGVTDAALRRAAPAADGPQLVQPGNSEVNTALYIALTAGPAQAAGRSLRRRRPGSEASREGQVVTPEPGPPKALRCAAASSSLA